MNKEEVFRGSMQWSRGEFKDKQDRVLRGDTITNLNINVDQPYPNAGHVAMIPVSSHSYKGIRCSSSSVANDLWDYLASEI